MNDPIVPADDTEVVAFASHVGSSKPGFEAHGPGDQLAKTVGELRNSYRKVVGQILAMTNDTPSDDAMRLTTVEVGLAFSAEGELGFIAKASASVEASITLTFERQGTEPSGR
jgi:Trypsin-co-occurring domain 1